MFLVIKIRKKNLIYVSKKCCEDVDSSLIDKGGKKTLRSYRRFQYFHVWLRTTLWKKTFLILLFTNFQYRMWILKRLFKDCFKTNGKYPSKHSSWWRRHEGDYCLHLQKTSLRCLDQDEYNRLRHTSSRRFQDVFKTSSRHPLDILQKRLQNVFKTSCKDVFKTYSRRFQYVFTMSSISFWDVPRRRSSTERFAYVTILRNLWSVSKNELIGNTKTFKTVFIKHFRKCLLLQINMLLLKYSTNKYIIVIIVRIYCCIRK